MIIPPLKTIVNIGIKMRVSGKFIKKQMAAIRPVLMGASLETVRKGQDKLGEIMRYTRRREVTLSFKNFSNFKAAWVTPNDCRRDGAILYLHGGGYTCGSLEYSLGFGSVLAAETGMRVFCIAYRLAPEHPYPAALEDAIEAYKYMLSEGVRHDRIILSGDSAGGGMSYALCLKLKAENLPCPCGIIAISPWTDLTASSDSYKENEKIDPSMTKEKLSYFADAYTSDREDPFVSPLFADLTGMPPSLIFVGGDEIMLGDSVRMHEKLLSSGCESELVVREGMWHGYVLFCLKENKSDFVMIDAFLHRILPYERKLRWMRLDNAAKIYPAARRRNWSNVFRLSADLFEDIDKGVMQSALDVTARRFPSIAVRMRRGLFWYYLEEMPSAPEISTEKCYPIARMDYKQIKAGALRVIVYKKRVAVEYFHALTDGTGGMIFLKTLVAEYLLQKYGVCVPNEHGVLDRLQHPADEELEDSFLCHRSDVAKSRSESTAYKIPGDAVRGDYSYNTTLTADSDEVLKKSKELGITVTAYICAALMCAICKIQKDNVKDPKRYKPVKVLIPVNLRPFFGSKSVRNFALYVTPEINQRLGEWSFEEVAQSVHHQMKLLITEKEMRSRITTNVNSERSFIVKILPLFLKNIAMKAVYNLVGERKSCLTLSNLGNVRLPDGMGEYVQRMDFVLGAQATTSFNCGMLSYNGTLYINFLRKCEDATLEREFFEVLKSRGIKVKAESNMSSLEAEIKKYK